MLILAGGFVSCSKDERDILLNTKWKLVGFMDVASGETKYAEPTNKWCYTITFKNNRKWEGRSAVNSMEGKYKINYSKNSISISIRLMTKVYCENCDEDLYVESLKNVDFFSIQENELKLYYNSKQNYLLYKSQ